MRAISLQSGSNGNCIYVESGETRLLFDAGISAKQAALRLAGHGRDMADVDALLVSHDHSDHTRSLGIFQRRWSTPVYATPKTFAVASSKQRLGPLHELRTFRAGTVLRFEDTFVETYSTPHDGADGVVFVVDDGTRRLGIFTDLGHVFDGLVDLVASLDAVFLESNYDPVMLAQGPYPPFLKRRIVGPGGHISNEECAGVLAQVVRQERLKWACLSHLSETNNRPELALCAHRETLGEHFPLHVAGRYAATPVLDV